MRIIYLSAATIPSRTANSIHVMKMCQALRQLGNQVELCAPKRTYALTLTHPSEIWTHYGIQETFAIRWIKSSNLLREYDYAWRAALHARHQRPDVVFARNVPAAAMTSLWGLPTICEIHDAPHLRGSLYQFSHHLLARGRGLRRLVVISQPFHELLLEFFQGKVAADKILILPDGVDLERFESLPDAVEARKRIGLPEAGMTLGYAGHLYPGRGVELILELARRLPQCRFLLAGGNDEDIASYRNEAQSKGVSNATFLGFITNSKLPQYLAACDVLLMPYQRKVAVSGGGDTSKWMSPLKVFEYMATGRLILSSDLAVLHEVLNEANCVFCPPEDIDAWHMAITHAIADPEWRNRIGGQAKRDVVRYSWTRRAQIALSGSQSGSTITNDER